MQLISHRNVSARVDTSDNMLVQQVLGGAKPDRHCLSKEQSHLVKKSISRNECIRHPRVCYAWTLLHNPAIVNK